jgi:hypothetical protein
MLHPLTWSPPEKIYGVLMTEPFNPLALIVLVWTAWRGWRLLPKAIQRHAQIAAIINVPLYIVFCDAGELRDLSLLFVTLLVLLAVNLNEWSGNRTGLLREAGAPDKRIEANAH